MACKRKHVNKCTNRVCTSQTGRCINDGLRKHCVFTNSISTTVGLVLKTLLFWSKVE